MTMESRNGTRRCWILSMGIISITCIGQCSIHFNLLISLFITKVQTSIYIKSKGIARPFTTKSLLRMKRFDQAVYKSILQGNVRQKIFANTINYSKKGTAVYLFLHLQSAFFQSNTLIGCYSCGTEVAKGGCRFVNGPQDSPPLC